MKTHLETSKLKNENAQLKRKLRVSKKNAEKLALTIIELENTFEIRFFEALDSINKEYYTFLNPAPEILAVYWNRKSEHYEVSVSDILWIESNGRLKTIFLKRPIKSKEGTRTTDKLIVDNDSVTIKSLLLKFDKFNFHLMKVSRSTIVNVAYFKIKGEILELSIRRAVNHALPSICEFSSKCTTYSHPKCTTHSHLKCTTSSIRFKYQGLKS